jgi:arylsulfatase A-like enzyme
VRFVQVSSSPPPEPPEQIVIDNTDPQAQAISGGWWSQSGGSGYEGTDFATSGNNTTNEFRWTPDLAGAAGEYDVYVKYASDWWNLGIDVPYTVVHNNGNDLTRVDQTQNGGQWVLLGRYTLSQGSYVSIGSDISDGRRPSADAVRFVKISDTATDRLNFVVILTDDQRWDTIDDMPVLLDRIASRGVTFRNSYVTTPVCGPIRANLLSGGFRAYNTGLISNPGDNGGELKFRGQDSDTIATALQQVGYQTMFAGGKYINGYVAPYIPPGWTRFVNNVLGPVASGWNQYDVVTGNSGSTSSTGSIQQVTQYVTDYHRDEVLDFLDNLNGADFLVYFSVFAPHGPAIPDALDTGSYQNYLYRDRAYGETDLSDKPDWVSNPNRFLTVKEPDDEFHRNQLRSLQSVDRAIGAIVDKVEEIGELDQTVFIFTSDNGYLWGEHGLSSKGMAYDESIRVPFIVSAPGVTPGENHSLIAVDLDIGATIFDMANISKPSDGQSLVPLLNDPNSPWREELVFQHWGPSEGAFGTWSAILTDQWKYIENARGEEELYDMSTDPYELVSEHNNPNFDFIRNELAQTLSSNRGLGLRTHSVPSGQVGAFYSVQLQTWGGQTPFTWTVEEGALPNGLTLNQSTGVISGIPTTAGEYQATISVEDSSLGRHSGQPQRVVGPGRSDSVGNYYTFTISP